MNSKRKLLTLVKPVPYLKPRGTGSDDAGPELAPPPGHAVLSSPPDPSGSVEDCARRQKSQSRTISDDGAASSEAPSRIHFYDRSFQSDHWWVSGTKQDRPLVIDFNNASTVKGLAKKLKREVRSWGDLISHHDALTIVARAFGHGGYEELHSRLGLANASQPDCAVPPEEAARRYRQYVTVLTENDFSIEEAVHLLKIVTHGSWWNFTGERAPTKIHGTRIKVEIEFVDPETARGLFEIFKRSLNAHGLRENVRARHFQCTSCRSRARESTGTRLPSFARILGRPRPGVSPGPVGRGHQRRRGDPGASRRIRRVDGHRGKRVGHLQAATPRRPGRKWTPAEIAATPIQDSAV
ncbi:hypothetical protein AMJ99_CH03119 [Rhizobium esperanzae]|nr:hypothetical protein AMJ99_CH03119 [Rhizobium esperanzae]ANM35486.1 hypothetical protein AMK04_CH03123 [Rhizobium sp. N871]